MFMTMQPQTWAVIYFAELLLISWAMGSLTIGATRLLPVPRWTRFLVGFASAPFLLGAWVLAVAAMLPGAPRFVFLLPPLIAAILIFFWRGRQTLNWLRRSISRSIRAVWKCHPLRLAFVFALVLVVLVAFKLARNSVEPIHAHDALVYLSEASIFSQERTLDAVNSFRDRPDGTLRGNWHNFLWPAFLSHALMHTDADVLGYPNDAAARAAFQWTVLCVLLSLTALAACVRYPGVSSLAVILLLQVPLFAYLSNQSSRDGFRIIPLLLLTAVLAGLSPQRLKFGFRWPYLIPPLLLAACCISGHALGGFIAVLIAFAWGLWGIIMRTRITRLTLVLGTVAIGLLLGGTHQLKAYIETGNFRGVEAECSIARLPPETHAGEVQQEKVAARGRYAELLRRDQYRVSIAGLLCALIAVAIGMRSRPSHHDRILLYFGLATLAITTPFLGLLDFGSYPITEWFTSNFRYQMHWYPFGAVCIASVTLFGYEQLRFRQKSSCRTVATAILVVLILLVSATACTTVYKRWHASANKRAEFMLKVGHIADAMNRMPPGKRLLLENARYNYYLGNKAMLIFSRPACEILEAQDHRQVKEALRRRNIAAVALEEESLADRWDHSHLLRTLADPEVAALTHQKGILIYSIHDDAPVS
jgi:hypothetical protein